MSGEACHYQLTHDERFSGITQTYNKKGINSIKCRQVKSLGCETSTKYFIFGSNVSKKSNLFQIVIQASDKTLWCYSTCGSYSQNALKLIEGILIDNCPANYLISVWDNFGALNKDFVKDSNIVKASKFRVADINSSIWHIHVQSCLGY